VQCAAVCEVCLHMLTAVTSKNICKTRAATGQTTHGLVAECNGHICDAMLISPSPGTASSACGMPTWHTQAPTRTRADCSSCHSEKLCPTMPVGQIGLPG
jgi:hypothetical protein